jgi:hypothetical protein
MAQQSCGIYPENNWINLKIMTAQFGQHVLAPTDSILPQLEPANGVAV